MAEHPEWVAPPPDWPNDDLDDAVSDWVIVEIDEIDFELERQFYTLRWGTHPGIPASEIFADAERAAVEAAREREDFRLLEELCHPAHPFNLHAGAFGMPPIRHGLADSTDALIKDDWTGARKRRANRPLESNDERRANNPIHDATDDAERIGYFLRCAYPKKDDKTIRCQAAHAAARRRIGLFREFAHDPSTSIKMRKLYEHIDEEQLREKLIVRLGRGPDDHRRPNQHPKKPRQGGKAKPKR